MTPRRRDNLKRLLAPRHAAFIGGEDAAVAVAQCTAMGFAGQIWGVNPRRKELAGYPCFAGIDDLPEAPDATFLAVPRRAAVGTLAALRDRGAAGAVCYAAGFGELGGEGAALEQALIEAAGDMALVGPNCYGLLNFVQGAAFWPFGFGGGRVARGIAIVTQSGMLGSNLTMNQRSAPLAYVISAGNQAVLGVEDYLDVLVEDPAVDAIGLHVEGLRDVPRFCDAAIRALEAEVPIVALKSGTSEIGARLTVSHTGSLAGTDDLYQALFDRLGIIRVDSPTQLLETLKFLSIAGVPKGHRLAGFACSGGDATMLADFAERVGLCFSPPTPAVAEDVAARLPEVATLTNPLDYTTPLWGQEAELAGVFGAMLAGDYDAALLVQDYSSPEVGFGNDSYRADARAFVAAARHAGLPAAVCNDLPENIDRESREIIAAGGVAPLQGIGEALAALAGAAAYGERRARVMASGGAAALALPPVIPQEGASEVLDEWHSKQALAAAGVPVPEGRLADVETAPAVAAELGFPVALKLVSAALPHKTEAGAVRLGLTSTAEVAAAAAAITESVARQAPGVAADRFLVERMAAGPVAELLVGIRRDAQFGQVMVLASGGILVELLRDTQTLLLPAGRETVSRALDALKLSRLLEGYRGRPPGDRQAALEAVLVLADFARANRNEIMEVEINPLMILPEGALAVDALLRRAKPDTAG